MLTILYGARTLHKPRKIQGVSANLSSKGAIEGIQVPREIEEKGNERFSSGRRVCGCSVSSLCLAWAGWRRIHKVHPPTPAPKPIEVSPFKRSSDLRSR